MQIFRNKDFDNKKSVKTGYDKCAKVYFSNREKENEPSLQWLTDRLLPNSRLLDIGCGSGVPVDKILSRKHSVTGIDISEQQIILARENVQGAEFICEDIMQINLQKNYWDAIISYYAIFHLNKDEQTLLFERIYKSLRENGYILFSLTNDNEDAYTESDFFGTEMYWSNYSLDEYLSMLKKIGFDIIHSGILNHGHNADYDGKDEIHPIILGQKSKEN
jgi:2-polyprenyl-3-methyl-5-hydroxy-6-metoxy-1,4-benzoquinol methylase